MMMKLQGALLYLDGVLLRVDGDRFGVLGLALKQGPHPHNDLALSLDLSSFHHLAEDQQETMRVRTEGKKK